ncbi:hypothetical protein EBX93_11745 [bacterium]|nr:hypothetical protein [bacterium]
MLHVKTEEIYGKNPIVNVQDLRTHIINIDSRMRKSHMEPPTDFQYDLAHVYKNVIRARVASVEIPGVFYNFSGKKKNTMFRLDATDCEGVMHHIEICIPEGNYTNKTLLDGIQQEMNGIRDMYGIFFRITLDERTQKVTIHHDGSALPPCPQMPTHCPVSFGLMFGMVGQEERMYDFGLGFNLGFVKQIYVVDTPAITSESVIQTTGDAYFLLAIDDMYTVEHRIADTYIQCLAKILVKRTAEGILYDNGYTVLSNEITFPRPVDLKQVRVRLLDKYGVPVDIHYTNMSVSLEITEVMNVQMYDSYRNYVWEKAEPHAVKHVSGSAAPFAAPGRNFN